MATNNFNDDDHNVADMGNDDDDEEEDEEGEEEEEEEIISVMSSDEEAQRSVQSRLNRSIDHDAPGPLASYQTTAAPLRWTTTVPAGIFGSSKPATVTPLTNLFASSSHTGRAPSSLFASSAQPGDTARSGLFPQADQRLFLLREDVAAATSRRLISLLGRSLTTTFTSRYCASSVAGAATTRDSREFFTSFMHSFMAAFSLVHRELLSHWSMANLLLILPICDTPFILPGNKGKASLPTVTRTNGIGLNSSIDPL